MSIPPAKNTRVVGVASTYLPDCHVAARMRAAAQQCERLLVVDDSGLRASTLESDLPSDVTLINNRHNLGLARSLNRAIVRAIRMGATHVVTLDDDTELPSGFVHGLVCGMTAAQRKGGAVLTAGAGTVNGDRDGPYGHVHAFSHGECSLSVMQSGMLIDVRAFEAVGLLREEFVIDGLEQEFLARLHGLGFHTLLVEGVDLVHHVGCPTERRFLTRKVVAANHSAFRHYYITRNLLTLARENAGLEEESTEVVRRWLRRHALKALLYEDHKYAKARAMVRGYLDFRFGRLGYRVSPPVGDVTSDRR